MTKPVLEITDEMIERSAKAAFCACRGGSWENIGESAKATWRFEARIMLTAALTPDPEPEIEVSEGMCEAAMRLYTQDGGQYLVGSMFAKYYRAMERKRLEEKKGCSKDFGETTLCGKKPVNECVCNVCGQVHNPAITCAKYHETQSAKQKLADDLSQIHQATADWYARSCQGSAPEGATFLRKITENGTFRTPNQRSGRDRRGCHPWFGDGQQYLRRTGVLSWRMTSDTRVRGRRKDDK